MTGPQVQSCLADGENCGNISCQVCRGRCSGIRQCTSVDKAQCVMTEYGELNQGEPTQSELTKLNQQISRSPCFKWVNFFLQCQISSNSFTLFNKLLSCLNPERRTQAPPFAKQIHSPEDEVSCVADEW